MAVSGHEVESLLVHDATGIEYEKAKGALKLENVAPSTLLSSDRPLRIAGHSRTDEYLQFWKAGPDSFLEDPPNATSSVFEKGKDERADVVVTLRNPRVSGNDLTYDITVISGTLPRPGMGPASPFIDIIGCRSVRVLAPACAVLPCAGSRRVLSTRAHGQRHQRGRAGPGVRTPANPSQAAAVTK